MVRITRPLFEWIKHASYRKWYYGLSGYNRFGLYQNDLWCLGHYPMCPEHEGVYLEALRRLPAEEYDHYMYRLIRASQCEVTKSFVPPADTPTYEEDETKGRFLEPYVKEILAEKREKEEWQEFLSKK